MPPWALRSVTLAMLTCRVRLFISMRPLNKIHPSATIKCRLFEVLSEEDIILTRRQVIIQDIDAQAIQMGVYTPTEDGQMQI